ncbi:2,4'-dihydroxyacetophenone dioxygenase [Mycobacterium frederiksbergense]|uniref:2,4'-dihydroxyacetophenone dioxygenase n=1 Tax=Mycolicibacterium frederiksbergense TaxID=117567 RepID=A0ABT6KVS8_9MYCO|nr:2,4'-dihydroxyacetophenone dioxygenase family protein [Mycolicibacterium frederiksbergense]MDH6193970.1 2,4'-dihydroxyacetophenone dioxygenase [Mycolicibacterium frederiksbergense]
MTTSTPHTAFDPPIFGHLGMRPELVVAPVSDERVWLEIEPLVWLRPLFFDMNTGAHGEVLRVRKGGVLSRHKHPSPVHGFVLKGEWHYLEHTWTAVEGSYVFEPPGEVHSLTVDGDCEEMQTLFFIQGPIVNIDENDQVVRVEDNIDLIERLREAYEANGLGADFVNQFIR